MRRPRMKFHLPILNCDWDKMFLWIWHAPRLYFYLVWALYCIYRYSLLITSKLNEHWSSRSRLGTLHHHHSSRLLSSTLSCTRSQSWLLPFLPSSRNHSFRALDKEYYPWFINAYRDDGPAVFKYVDAYSKTSTAQVGDIIDNVWLNSRNCHPQ